MSIYLSELYKMRDNNCKYPLHLVVIPKSGKGLRQAQPDKRHDLR